MDLSRRWTSCQHHQISFSFSSKSHNIVSVVTFGLWPQIESGGSCLLFLTLLKVTCRISRYTLPLISNSSFFQGINFFIYNSMIFIGFIKYLLLIQLLGIHSFLSFIWWSWDFILPNVNSSFVERRAASFHDFVVWRVSTYNDMHLLIGNKSFHYLQSLQVDNLQKSRIQEPILYF